jgi:hypothetical protein
MDLLEEKSLMVDTTKNNATFRRICSKLAYLNSKTAENTKSPSPKNQFNIQNKRGPCSCLA